MSQRRPCRLARLSRKTASYRRQVESDRSLRERLKQLAEQYPRYGYLMLHTLLRSEGLVENRKRNYGVYTELGWQVRTKSAPIVQDNGLEPTSEVMFFSPRISEGGRILFSRASQHRMRLWKALMRVFEMVV